MIQGTTVLVIGLGDIGRAFAGRMKALGCHTIGIRRRVSGKTSAGRRGRPFGNAAFHLHGRPFGTQPAACADSFSGAKLAACAVGPSGTRPAACMDGFSGADEVYGLDALDSLLPRADVVALSLPGNPSTRHVLNRERIGLLNPNAIVLNVGRGTAIDTDALCDALYGGRIAGAALDVTDPEPTAGGPSPLGCAPHPDHPSYFRRLFPAGNAGADLRHLRGKSGTFPEGRTASERGGYGDRVRFRTACAVNAQTWLKRNGTFHGTGDRTKCSMNFCRKKFCRIFRELFR